MQGFLGMSRSEKLHRAFRILNRLKRECAVIESGNTGIAAQDAWEAMCRLVKEGRLQIMNATYGNGQKDWSNKFNKSSMANPVVKYALVSRNVSTYSTKAVVASKDPSIVAISKGNTHGIEIANTCINVTVMSCHGIPDFLVSQGHIKPLEETTPKVLKKNGFLRLLPVTCSRSGKNFDPPRLSSSAADEAKTTARYLVSWYEENLDEANYMCQLVST